MLDADYGMTMCGFHRRGSPRKFQRSDWNFNRPLIDQHILVVMSLISWPA